MGGKAAFRRHCWRCSIEGKLPRLTTTLEGVRVYTVYHRSAESGWSAAIGIPTDTVDGPVIRSYLVLGGSILVAVMLGLGAAFLTGRTVTGPMRKLERAAAAVARGEAPMLPETDLPEIRQAMLALLAAHIERDKLLHSERQARLLEQNARLAAELANKTKDEFLAMLGHELRNPLAAIATAAQVLDQSEQTQRKDVEQHAQGIIRRQVRHLAKLTDDLLDAARVMMGKIVLDRRPVDLAQLVRNTVDTLRNTGQLQRHECVTQLEPVWVNVDPTRIDQVLANLLTNAVKYTPPPGRIEVSVRRERRRGCVQRARLRPRPRAGAAAEHLRSVRAGRARSRSLAGRPRHRPHAGAADRGAARWPRRGAQRRRRQGQ